MPKTAKLPTAAPVKWNGMALKASRESRDLSQQALSFELSKMRGRVISPGNISLWERGEAAPDAVNLVNLCRLFRAPVESFFCDAS